MKFSKEMILKGVKMVNAISNPNQAIGMALNSLSKKSPETAEMISKMIKAGKSPNDAIKQFANEGKINIEQLKEIKGIYGMAKKVGLKNFNVPNSVWSEAEKSISTNDKNGGLNQNQDWF